LHLNLNLSEDRSTTVSFCHALGFSEPRFFLSYVKENICTESKREKSFSSGLAAFVIFLFDWNRLTHFKNKYQVKATCTVDSELCLQCLDLQTY